MRLDVECPNNLYTAIDDALASDIVVETDGVVWRDWKNCLNRLFCIPATLKINAYYAFPARCDAPRTLLRKQFHGTATWIVVHLVQDGITAAHVVRHMLSLSHNKFLLSNTSLDYVKATQMKNRLQYTEDEVCER